MAGGSSSGHALSYACGRPVERSWAIRSGHETSVGRATWSGRIHADEIDALAAESFSKLTVEETLEPMLEKGIPVGLVYDALEVLELDQLEARGFFSTIVDPEVGSVRIPGTPWTAFVDGISFERAPNLGEHNAEIETELERARLARQL